MKQLTDKEHFEQGGRNTPDRNEYPEATPKPCSDCPWRREAAAGWLGPMNAEEWIEVVHSDTPIACHQTITEVHFEDGSSVGDWDHPAIRQCRGAAIFRANMCKSPRNPTVATGPTDQENVFANNQEFIDYHNKEGTNE